MWSAFYSTIFSDSADNEGPDQTVVNVHADLSHCYPHMTSVPEESFYLTNMIHDKN